MILRIINLGLNFRGLSFLQIDKSKKNIFNDKAQHSSVSLMDESKLEDVNLDHQLK